ncbi:MAG: glycine zipper 2TM domain-containing protein [Pseudomonadota bacterium]
MRKSAIAIGSLVATLVLAGCAPSQSPGVYQRDQAMRGLEVQTGVIENIRSIVIEGNRSVASQIGGAVVGGVLGSTVGSGAGRRLATTAGAAAGTVAGQAAEERATRQQGVEVTVRLTDGSVIAVAQAVDPSMSPFMLGERVRVLRAADGTLRVSR